MRAAAQRASWTGSVARTLFALAIALTAAAASAQARPREGEPAPAFTAPLLDGRRVALEHYAGKVLLLNFWATWCAPCRAEMPAMQAYYAQHRAQGFEVLAISVDRPGELAAVVDAMRPYTFPAGLAHDASFAAYGRIWRMPTTFVIDRRGILRRNGASGAPIVIDAAMLEREVTPLVAQH